MTRLRRSAPLRERRSVRPSLALPALLATLGLVLVLRTGCRLVAGVVAPAHASIAAGAEDVADDGTRGAPVPREPESPPGPESAPESADAPGEPGRRPRAPAGGAGSEPGRGAGAGDPVAAVLGAVETGAGVRLASGGPHASVSSSLGLATTAAAPIPARPVRSGASAPRWRSFRSLASSPGLARAPPR